MPGIPYADELEFIYGKVGWYDDMIVGVVVECPDCHTRIECREPKDEESFSHYEYRIHYEKEHQG